MSEEPTELSVTIKIDKSGYTYETNMAKPEVVYWLDMLSFTLKTELVQENQAE